jgi:hypothetical protein
MVRTADNLFRIKQIFMKHTLIFSAVFAFVFSLASCSKCTTCTKSGSSDVELCETSYSSTTAYEGEINNREAQGYSCSSQ